ncbi:MAG: TIR domain-containing protein [Methanoregula sp.]|uniref:TIR domain-containing protein n=2 Tax=Methanoregula sp. TaxID=2052170 RepID=UPI003C68734B
MVEKIEDGSFSEENSKLKLFIAYSHKDNTLEKTFIEDFKTHIAPFKNNCLVEEWYDHELLPGDELERINSNLENSDIICLFLSAYFLDSRACMNEKRKAMEFRKKKGVQVMPIILSPCGWKEDPDIIKLKSMPTDGKPVSSFIDKNEAWQDVCEGLKKLIERETRIKNLTITGQFNKFLYDADLFTKNHSTKETVSLNDIYIDTELQKIDSFKKISTIINSHELLDNLLSEKKIIIAGENQSGKTTLCKRLFCDLRTLNLIPVYVSAEKISHPGKIDNFIEKSLHEQYNNFNESELNREKIVPIIDDFHYVEDKEKHITNLLKYSLCVIIVDEIFNINIKDETLIYSFTTFRIKELKPSIRYELVKKWVGLSDKGFSYQGIDNNVELINNTLGRNIGKGLIPAYPFFILSTLFTYETFLPLNQDITSQGHCYQAFIYYYLGTKRGVKFDAMDVYLNFLSEVASYMHLTKKNELNPYDFSNFMKNYSSKYNLPISQDILLDNLFEIFSKNSFNNYKFKYQCFYYYFVAKAFSDHAEEPKEWERILDILHNLQIDENAYITVFLIHHSKKIGIFDEIERISSSLFSNYRPATLDKDELGFFDEQSHNIVKAVLPPTNHTPEMERNRRLKLEDQMEQSSDSEIEQVKGNGAAINDFRKAIKTVEVMGCIIRNRAGSLERDKLQNIFLDGMNVHLRLLSSFINIIKGDNEQKEIVEYISKRLSHLDEGKNPNEKLTEEKKKKYAYNIFWNANFFVIYGILYKIVHSLGSDKLIEISNQICENIDNPSSILVKHGILMGYEKNLQIDELNKRINENDFSKIAKKVAEMIVVDYSSVNQITYRDKQRIENTLNISRHRLK